MLSKFNNYDSNVLVQKILPKVRFSYYYDETFAISLSVNARRADMNAFLINERIYYYN